MILTIDLRKNKDNFLMIYNGGFETRYIQVAFFLAVDELGDRRGYRERESMQSLVIWIFRFDPQKVCTKCDAQSTCRTIESEA